jgi:hypothetical protein
VCCVCSLQQTLLTICNREPVFCETYDPNITQKKNFKLRRVKIRCREHFYSHSFPGASQRYHKTNGNVKRFMRQWTSQGSASLRPSAAREHNSTHTVTSVFRVAGNDIELCGIHHLELNKQLNNGSRWKLFNPALTLPHKMTRLRYSRDLWWWMFGIRFSISEVAFLKLNIWLGTNMQVCVA